MSDYNLIWKKKFSKERFSGQMTNDFGDSTPSMWSFSLNTEAKFLWLEALTHLTLYSRTLAAGPWAQEMTSAPASTPTTVSPMCRCSVWICWVTHSHHLLAVLKVRQDKSFFLTTYCRAVHTFNMLKLLPWQHLSAPWLAQGLMSASGISTGEASASERPVGWRWATSPLESVTR